jgi:ribosome-binding protein aMBF1 (putative translation factor)
MVEHCIDADSENHRARVSRNPTRAEAVVRGRRRLGETIDHQNPGRRSLASLRLAAGLSQSQLAERIGMVQPNVARLERKPGDLPLSRLKLLAKALGVDLETVAAAVDICNDVEAEDV